MTSAKELIEQSLNENTTRVAGAISTELGSWIWDNDPTQDDFASLGMRIANDSSLKNASRANAMAFAESLLYNVKKWNKNETNQYRTKNSD